MTHSPIRFWLVVFAMLLSLVSLDAAAARRLGGGTSVGKQSPNVTQREAQRSAPAPVPAAPSAQPAQRSWGGLLGGIAAGLGLAWLANTLGFGDVFGQFLVVLLFVIVAMTLVGWLVRSRRHAANSYAFGGPSAADSALPLRQYSPDKVGNDASARPWERASMAFDAAKYTPAQAGTTKPRWNIPEAFDVEGFVATAKGNFTTLQDAWDRADLVVLRSMMTDEMLGEIKSQLAEREKQLGGQANRTEVVMLEAQLLGIEDLGGDYMASVEFSGMIREEPSAGPSPFREVWNMTKPKNGSTGWLVAGVQALQ
jgi:predicted lipid-binding transport protein (Tim44 family)